MANCALLVACLFAIFSITSADVSKRKIVKYLYPDCNTSEICKENRDLNATTYPNVSFPNLVYIRASADSDILHFVLTTINLPSILIIHTTKDANASLHFNWDRLLNSSVTDLAGAIAVTGAGNVEFTFAVIFSRLIEYDDVNDAADLTEAEKEPKTLWHIRNFTDFHWMNVTLGQGNTSIIFNSTYPQDQSFGNNSGFMAFEFEINGDDGRDSDLPRLIYNANNTQFNFILDNYVPSFNKSRFALEVSVISNSSKMNFEEIKSIDDEYSPGVFRLENWHARGDAGGSGYLQWKPVCYLSSQRSRSVGTKVVSYDLLNSNKVESLESLLEQSLAQAFFGDLYNVTGITKNSVNVSFGLSQDGFYIKNNYTVWTASVGYGSAPVEAISTMVLAIIAAGLGIPVVIIIFGGIYVCIRRRRSGYQQIGSEVCHEYPALN